MPNPNPTGDMRTRGRPRSDADSVEPVTVQALDRAMEVLGLLAKEDGQTLSDLAQRSGLPAPSVYRALATLQAHQMVEVSEPGQLWHVGVGAFRIGSAFARRNSIVDRARRPMQDLHRQSGETAVLAQQAEGEVLVLAQSAPESGIRASFPAGVRGAMHTMALGKVMLAFLPEAQARAILAAKGMAKATSLTITSESSLLRDLARIRERGYAMDDQESAEGLRSIAAPIFGTQGEVVAALGLVGPAFRFGLSAVNSMVASLRNTADQLTQATGGTDPRLT